MLNRQLGIFGGVVASVSVFAVLMLCSLLLVGTVFERLRYSPSTGDQVSYMTPEASAFNLGVALFIVLIVSTVHAAVVLVSMLLRSRSIRVGKLIGRATVAALGNLVCLYSVMGLAALKTSQSGTPSGWVVLLLLVLGTVAASVLPYIFGWREAAQNS